MNAAVQRAFHGNVAGIDGVHQNSAYRCGAERNPDLLQAGLGHPRLRPDAHGLTFAGNRSHVPTLEEAGEYVPDYLRLLVDSGQASALQIVAKRRPAPTPQPLKAHRTPLVANAVPRHLTLKLSKGEQDVHDQAAEAVGSVEVLGNAREGDAIALEPVQQADEVQQAPTEAIELVYDHNIDATAFNIGKEILHGRAIQGAAGLRGILVNLAGLDPALVLLALDIG